MNSARIAVRLRPRTNKASPFRFSSGGGRWLNEGHAYLQPWAGINAQEDQIGAAAADLVPLARLMGEQIQTLRAWAKGRARLATTPAEAAAGRKLAA